MDKLTSFVEGYVGCLERNLQLRSEPTTKEDWYHGEMSSVIGGLIARQITLTMHLALSPHCWNGHVAPLFLRSMIDAHISLAWILKAPVERSKEYVAYGLGQEKLSLGHLERRLDSEVEDADLSSMIETKKDWINGHTMMALLEVNLGSWSGASVRQMCKDIDDEDFYHFSFTPFSACVHNSWHHISLYNCWPCENPLHKKHFVPAILETGYDLDFVYRSAKYASMSLRVFDKALGLKVSEIDPRQWVIDNEPPPDTSPRTQMDEEN